MTATEPFTPTRAYECHVDFRNLVDEWVRERRCPLPLVDLCLELHLDAAAECARWAATEPDSADDATPPNMGGPYPGLVGLRYYWYTSINTCPFGHPHFIPRGCHGVGCVVTSGTNYPTPLLAILWLLDNWQVSDA